MGFGWTAPDVTWSGAGATDAAPGGRSLTPT